MSHVAIRSRAWSLVARISLPAAALIGASLLSILQAPYPELSAYEVIEVVKMYFLFLYLANNIRDDHDLKFIIHAFIALLIFEGALSYLQHRYRRALFPVIPGGARRESTGECRGHGRISMTRPGI